MTTPYLTPVIHPITQAQRAEKNGHRGGVLWFTGFSGAGKSTLALRLEHALFKRNCQVYVLDGDNIRSSLCQDLDFSTAQRTENIRRASAVAKLFADAGMIVIASFITPSAADRALAHANTGHYFRCVHINADLKVCEQRDVKGLYKLARSGAIENFTGISSPYEIPLDADLVIDSATASIEDCTKRLLRYVEEEFIDKKNGQ